MSTQQKIKKGIVDSLAYMISEDSRTSQDKSEIKSLPWTRQPWLLIWP